MHNDSRVSPTSQHRNGCYRLLDSGVFDPGYQRKYTNIFAECLV